MENFFNLYKYFKLQQLLLTTSSQNRLLTNVTNRASQRYLSSSRTALNINRNRQSPAASFQHERFHLHRRSFSDEISKSTNKGASRKKDTNTNPHDMSAQVLIDEFRQREEQRERLLTEAEAQVQAQSTRKQEEDKIKDEKLVNIRKRILDAAILHVPVHGWSRNALAAGAEDAGYTSVAHGMFPEAGFAIVSHFNSRCNEDLVRHLQLLTNNGQKQIDNPLDFLVDAVRHRFEMIVPFKKQWPQALALIAMPQNAATSLAQILTLVDDICYYSGDRSVDFNWYTRRVGLATIMKMTELYMLQDSSPDHEKTWIFLKNRMDEAVQLQTMLSQTEGVTTQVQRSFNSAFITARNILGLGYDRN